MIVVCGGSWNRKETDGGRGILVEVEADSWKIHST